MHPCEPFLVVHPTHIFVHTRVHRAQQLKSAVLGITCVTCLYGECELLWHLGLVQLNLKQIFKLKFATSMFYKC